MTRPYLKNAPTEFIWPPSAEELQRRGYDTSAAHLLGLNEVTMQPSPAVQSALAEHRAQINRYPEAGSNQLREIISAHTGINPDHQLWTAGMSDLLLRLMISLKVQDSTLVMQTPNFWGYEKLIKAYGIKVNRVPLLTEGPYSGAADIEGLLAAISPDTSVVSITTPCNPTGICTDPNDLRKLCRSVPNDVLLFIDEAYHEFSVHSGGNDALEIVSEERSKGIWIVGRTFSKAYALAGARIGYGLCSDLQTASYIRSFANEFCISRYAQLAAVTALGDGVHQQLIMRHCAEQRNALLEGLVALGLSPYPSITNFVSVEIPLPAIDVVRKMAEQGIFIARWLEPGHDQMLRLSVGSAEDTRATLLSLQSILDRPGS